MSVLKEKTMSEPKATEKKPVALSPYQRRSEGYLSESANAARQALNASLAMSNLGQNIYNESKARTSPLWGQIAGLAGRSTNWMAQQAAVDTGIQFDKNQGILARQLGRMGINPNSGRFAGLMWANNLARAASTAGAINRARRQAEEIQFNRLANAYRLGDQSTEGLNLMNQRPGAFGNAAGAFRGLAGDYGSLAGSEAGYGAMRDWRQPNQGSKVSLAGTPKDNQATQPQVRRGPRFIGLRDETVMPKEENMPLGFPFQRNEVRTDFSAQPIGHTSLDDNNDKSWYDKSFF